LIIARKSTALSDDEQPDLFIDDQYGYSASEALLVNGVNMDHLTLTPIGQSSLGLMNLHILRKYI